jgi:hypothetical protein
VFVRNSENRHDIFAQEETLKIQLSYLRLAVPEYGERLVPLLHSFTQGTRQPPTVVGWSAAKLTADLHRQGMPLKGPFDVFVDDDVSGESVLLIGADARSRVQRFTPTAAPKGPQRPPTPLGPLGPSRRPQ